MVDSRGVTIFQKCHQNPEAMVGRNRIDITRLRRDSPQRGILVGMISWQLQVTKIFISQLHKGEKS